MAKQKPNSKKKAGKPDAAANNGKPAPRMDKPLRGSSVPQSQRKGGR